MLIVLTQEEEEEEEEEKRAWIKKAKHRLSVCFPCSPYSLVLSFASICVYAGLMPYVAAAI
jgi:hypothetical protein